MVSSAPKNVYEGDIKGFKIEQQPILLLSVVIQPNLKKAEKPLTKSLFLVDF